MNFYKCSDYFWINLDLVTNISKINGDWFVFFVNDVKKLITTIDAFELKKILFPENKKKDVRQVRLVCDKCGETFNVNVPFDENGVSVSPVIFTRFCSKCIKEVKE